MTRPQRPATGRALALASVCLACVVGVPPAAAAGTIPEVPALRETTPSPMDGATGVVAWVDPADPARSLLVTGDENGALVLLDLAGAELQVIAEGPLKSVDLRYDVLLGAERVDLVVVSVEDAPELRFFHVDPAARRLVAAGTLPIGIPSDGACFYRSPFTGRLFAIATSESGLVEQWRIDGEDGTITGSLARRIPVGSEVAACVADDERGILYVSEEEVGVWRYGAEPEAGIARRLVDAGRRHLDGSGGLEEQAEGLAIVAYPDGEGFLVVADEKRDALAVYSRDDANRRLGSVRIGAGPSADAVSEPGGIAVLPIALGPDMPAGIVIASDDTNTGPSDDRNFKIAGWDAVLAALGLPVEPSGLDPRRTIAFAPRDRLPVVTPVAETLAVATGRDAADDPAIYLHPTDPALHAIIGTDKTGALNVYGLDGGLRQALPIGRVNNVDLRDGVLVGGVPRTLVATVNRTDDALWLYLVDEATGTLVPAHAAPVPSDVNEVYGLCLGRDPATGATWAFVNSADTGEVEQYRITDAGDGVGAERVRTFVVGGQTEGCVVDDAAGRVFIGEEARGIRSYGADPAAGDAYTWVDTTEAGGHLSADVEGLAIVATGERSGFLVASSQGDSTFAVYDRQAPHPWLGSFRVADGETVDGVSGTDGIDATAAVLPEPFAGGLLVVQDDRNREPDAGQNFKLVRWADVAAALGLAEAGG